MLGPNTVGTKQLKNNAVVSTKIKNRSLLAVDFKAGQLPRGAKGDPGAPGAPGAPGSQGLPGPFPDPLSAGKTLRGTYFIAGSNGTTATTTHSAVSFGFRLPSAPTVHYVPAGTSAPVDCPGRRQIRRRTRATSACSRPRRRTPRPSGESATTRALAARRARLRAKGSRPSRPSRTPAARCTSSAAGQSPPAPPHPPGCRISSASRRLLND